MVVMYVFVDSSQHMQYLSRIDRVNLHGSAECVRLERATFLVGVGCECWG
jgi:hypothetical protein